MKRIVMFGALSLAFATLAYANPIIIDPADEFLRVHSNMIFVSVLIIWGMLGVMMILAGLNLKFVATIPFYLSFIAIIFGVSRVFLYFWLIYLGFMGVRLFLSRPIRDPNSILNLTFHISFFVALILLDQVNIFWKLSKRTDLVGFGITYAAFICVTCLIYKLFRRKSARRDDSATEVINEPDKT